MNVRINLQDMADDAEAAAMLRRADDALARTIRAARTLEAEVWGSLGGGELP
jgi:hypothetical protein